MAIHIISILGTNVYAPIYYGNSVEEAKSLGIQDFIQLSIMKRYKTDLLNGGKVTFFLTERARKQNWEDRELINDENKNEDDIVAKFKYPIMFENGIKIGLENQIKLKIPELEKLYNVQKIPGGSTENEIWEIFNAIYDCIGEGDEIVFDITHSFRSIPMLAITVLNYAKVMKNISLKGIFYGAYEARYEDKEEKLLIAPIFDLTSFNDILEWTSAAESFIRSGNANHMRILLSNKKRYFSPAQRNQIKDLEYVVNSAAFMSNAISTCRGKYTTEENKGTSIKCAYLNMKEAAKNLNNGGLSQMNPLYNLMQKAIDSYKSFDKEINYQFGLEVVNWSISNNLTQQGFTALEETIKTYLCHYFGYDECDEYYRDDVVGSLMMAMDDTIQEFNEKNPSRKIRNNEGLMRHIDDILESVKNDQYVKTLFYKEIDGDNGEKNFVKSEDYENYERIVRIIPYEMVIVAKNVKNLRNDINHFGIRKKPDSSDLFTKNLKKYYEQTVAAIIMMEPAENVVECKDNATFVKKTPVFVNFSNHRLENWGEKQLEAAKAYGEVQDVAFPVVGSMANEEEIDALAEQCYAQIMTYHPDVVMCQGEFTLTFNVVKRLIEDGVTCVSACTERIVEEVVLEDGTIQKTSTFEFAKFREYKL